jgi:glucose/arabinose dehydrogenase
MNKGRNIILFVFWLAGQCLIAQPNLQLEVVKSGLSALLSNPVHITHAGDGSGRFFVCEKESGHIKVFDTVFNLIDTLVTVTGMSTGGEQGLLSLAFHPSFHTNGFFFINYVKSNGKLAIDRYHHPTLARTPIMEMYHPYNNHNGGEMHFGRDGYLYISTGDGGDGNDPLHLAQNDTSKLGKILRINIDVPANGNNYSVPVDNPYANNNPAIVKGLRNPFRWSFDRKTGDMWIGDVGQSAREEVDYIPADSILGTNFGWRCFEGNIKNINIEPQCTIPYRRPAHEYNFGSTTRSVIGGTIYRGYKFPTLYGRYIFKDFYSSNIGQLNKVGNNFVATLNSVSINNVADIGEGEDGELYAIKYGSNTANIYRIKPDGVSPKNVYTFIGNGLWTNPQNWLSNKVPPTTIGANQVIVIKPRKNGTCTLNNIQYVASLNSLFLEPGVHFVVNGRLEVK